MILCNEDTCVRLDSSEYCTPYTIKTSKNLHFRKYTRILQGKANAKRPNFTDQPNFPCRLWWMAAMARQRGSMLNYFDNRSTMMTARSKLTFFWNRLNHLRVTEEDANLTTDYIFKTITLETCYIENHYLIVFVFYSLFVHRTSVVRLKSYQYIRIQCICCLKYPRVSASQRFDGDVVSFPSAH